MKKQLIFTIITILLFSYCYGQTDTIYSNNGKIECFIKEIAPDVIKYTLNGEDILNSIYKNSVQKVVFKNGRIQTFTEGTSFKKVESVDDYENVSITQVESEIKGLFKIGDVSSKAQGATTVSDQEQVKRRAYMKFKIEAAMMGANIIYLTNQRTEGSKFSLFSSYPGSKAQASLTGIAYSNIIPSFDKFEELVGDKENFEAIFESSLKSNESTMSQKEILKKFTINEIINENGFIILIGNLEKVKEPTKFRVVSFTNQYFNIYYSYKTTVYNIKISF